MAIHTYTMPHNARRLHEELLAAIPELEPVVGDSGLPEANLLLSSAGTSLTLTVPDSVTPAELDPVLAAHDPTPDPPPVTEFAASLPVDAIVRTTDATPLEVFRFPCEPRSLYEAVLVIRGIDAGNFAVKRMNGEFVWKRITGNAIITGLTVVSDIHDTAAASWLPNYAAAGTDVVFTVQGAAGRTIDWRLNGEVSRYAPGGLEP